MVHGQGRDHGGDRERDVGLGAARVAEVHLLGALAEVTQQRAGLLGEVAGPHEDLGGERALEAQILAGAKLIVTSGGTGVGPRDETPEGTRRVVTREVPGIVEELRRRGAAEMPAGILSRGVAGVADPHGALIVNLPGSPKGVASGMPVVLSVAQHVLAQLGGSDH